LIERTQGIPEIKIGLIDGPIFEQHADLTGLRYENVSDKTGSTCGLHSSTACLHGTFVAGILAARRNSMAPAICPGCTLLVRPIFAENTSGPEQMPSAAPGELGAAIVECIEAGAKVINLSLALGRPSGNGEAELEEALDHAARLNVIVIAAAGNQGTMGSSAITRHPWVIPVVACDDAGVPLDISNLGRSIGRSGLKAPGKDITSLSAKGGYVSYSGTSVAVPFVTGAAALLMSLFPTVSASSIKLAIMGGPNARRNVLVPPLLDAEAAYQYLARSGMRRTANG